jgi:hypothetical protein
MVLVWLWACGGSVPAPAGGAAGVAGESGWAALRDRVVDELFDRQPQLAVGLGLHGYDGRVSEWSAESIEQRLAWLRSTRAALEAVPAAGLSDMARAERATLIHLLARELFPIESLRAPWRNPVFYLRQLNLDAYVVREYAPVSVRAKAVVAYTEGARQVLADARANLSGPIPRPWVELGLLITAGAVDFITRDVRDVFLGARGVEDPALRRDVEAALLAHAAEVRAFHDFLAGKRESAGGDYALGGALYLEGLAENEGLVTDLETLQRAAEESTARDLAALAEAAAEIDATKSVAEVVALVSADVPSPSEVLELAARQAAEARRFLETHPVVSIPSEEVAEVRLTPPFMRFNPAFLSGPGPFERASLPAYYYISPPDPSWPPEQQKAYLQPRNVLLFTTVHEVWPGHFLQDLYLKKQPSKVLKAFCSYANTEGWALYAEQAMWDAGFGGRDPKKHIGQLLSALMRDARFLVALGMHTRGMTVDEATRLFQEKAFMSLPAARQQAVRGTMDPYFSSYTLGKLMIEKLRDDWKVKLEADGKGKDWSLQAFHETFLAKGCQAIPVIREAMVGGGTAL